LARSAGGNFLGKWHSQNPQKMGQKSTFLDFFKILKSENHIFLHKGHKKTLKKAYKYNFLTRREAPKKILA
jgi:hypothetical protein